jgi:UDP-GlcNAc:undecaprenyl-phosphate GlcNAc-1-phosphate transferase
VNGDLLFAAGLISFAMALVACLVAKPLAHALGIMDMPDGVNGRKRHSRPTPLIGGVAIIFPFISSTFIFQPGLNGFPWIVSFATFGIFLVGFFDDRSHMRPVWRLIVSAFILAFAVAMIPDLRLTVLHFSFSDAAFLLPGTVAAGFALVCLLGLQNAVNMADGKNGLVIGMSIVWSAFLMLPAPDELRPILISLLISLTVTGFFNIRGKLFLGDAGSYSLAIILGMLSIYVFNHSAMALPADMIVLWFLIPVLDCIRLIFSRVSRGRAPFSPDRNHFHHVINDSMSWRYGLFVYLAHVILPGMAAFLWPSYTLALIVLSGFSYLLVYISLTRRLGVLGITR